MEAMIAMPLQLVAPVLSALQSDETQANVTGVFSELQMWVWVVGRGGV